jgi:ribosome recycling factor
MFEIKDCDNEMLQTVEAYSNDLKNIRTGRVSPDIMKSIIIDSYGSKMPITQLSNVNNIDNMTLSINIWDSSLTKAVEKAILESNLGATPQTDGNSILLKFPELTAERRKELVKIISDTSEKFKISLRNIRRKYIDSIKNMEKDKLISLDDSKRFQDSVQKSTDNFTSKIDDIAKVKDNEILKV